jgi:hypothetical protein
MICPTAVTDTKRCFSCDSTSKCGVGGRVFGKDITVFNFKATKRCSKICKNQKTHIWYEWAKIFDKLCVVSVNNTEVGPLFTIKRISNSIVDFDQDATKKIINGPAQTGSVMCYWCYYYLNPKRKHIQLKFSPTFGFQAHIELELNASPEAIERRSKQNKKSDFTNVIVGISVFVLSILMMYIFWSMF